MSPSNHDGNEYQFTQRMPNPRERVVVEWNTQGEPNSAIGADDFEDDVPGRIVLPVGISVDNLPTLDDRDQEDCQG